jgi:hypothetical protein
MRNWKHRIIYGGLWILFYLVVMDVAVNIAFRFPSDPQKNPPSFLQGYFQYGRSVEGKFDSIIQSAKIQSEPTLGYGWIQRKSNESLPQRAGKNQILVAAYGMSHTKLLAEAIAKIDRRYVIRQITAPGAPPGWSFATYEQDKDRHEARVIILGIMADNVATVSATSGATAYFDMSHPYTFPRYYIEKGLLVKVFPPFITEEGFGEYFRDPKKWAAYRDWLSKNDRFYNPFLFTRSNTDRSSLVRLLRRSYSELIKKKIVSQVYTKDGFNLKSNELNILQGIIKEFALSARDWGRIPFIYIVNNEGRGDHLFRALKPVLEDNHIPFLSTHTICPPDDPRVFLGTNSHFVPSKDIELAREAIRIFELELAETKKIVKDLGLNEG